MKIIHIIATYLLFCAFHAWAEQNYDFHVEPSSSDNFLEAAFRYTDPTPGELPRRILVYVPGTDGDARDVVDDPVFIDACRKCDAALIGCYFRGEGLPYDMPGGGSGRALDQALASFAAQTGNSRLAGLPLLLMGFSEGSQFAFNYICWHPDRVEAFAAIKAGAFSLVPQRESFQIPGLLVAGQFDEPERIRTTAKAFTGSAGNNSRWAFLFEKGAGHDMTRIESFALQFLDAACANSGNFVYRHADSPHLVASSSGGADVCCFPDEATAESWASLHQAVPLAELSRMPDLVSLDSLAQIELEPSSLRCSNGQKQDGTISVSTSKEGIYVGDVSISGDGFALAGAGEGKLPRQIAFSFAPMDLDWGLVSGEVTIYAEQAGHALAPDTIPLHGMVLGPATPVPGLLYLGITHPHEIIRRTVRLKVSVAGAQVTEIVTPPDLEAALENIKDSNDRLLEVTWSPSGRLGSMSGEIRIGFDAPQKGVLRIPVVGLVAKAGAKE